MNGPLGSADIERIVERHAGDPEVAVLVGEIERQADMISDCWLLLDALAHEAYRGTYGLAAERLLRKHRAPGWK